MFLLVSKFERLVRSDPRKLIKHITKESINGFHDHSTLKKTIWFSSWYVMKVICNDQRATFVLETFCRRYTRLK